MSGVISTIETALVDVETASTEAGTPPLPIVLTVDELAELLRVDRKSVYAAIKRGEIPGVRRLGRSVRLHRDTVLQWLSTGQDRAPRHRRIR